MRHFFQTYRKSNLYPNNDMTTPEIEELKRLVEGKYERCLNTTTDFEEFSLTLEQYTKRKVSSSTLKRMWGYVSDSHKPRMVTLDTLAQYLGYQNFSIFKDWLKTSIRYNSSFFDANQLASSMLKKGDELRIGWSPNRLLLLNYLGDSTYEVVSAENSKLIVGDRFVTGCFILGQPLYLPYILRKGEKTPSFVAGRNGGLTVIEKMEK